MHKYLFLDMDGVIAEFCNPFTGLVTVDDDEWNDPGMFINKRPVTPVIRAIVEKFANYKIIILSAAPNQGSVIEKNMWLDEHFPQTYHRYFLPWPNENKDMFILDWCTATNVPVENVALIDDTHRHLFSAADIGVKCFHPSTLLAEGFNPEKRL